MGFSFFSLAHLLTSIFIISPILQLESSTSPISPPTIQLPQSSFTLAVTDYGAAGDGLQYDTSYIQAAIDDCFAHGGGRVTFPPGTYLTATVFLKSGVVFEVQENATILGDTKLEDYPAENSRWYVVVAEDAGDVGIMGGGEINGRY